jgi:hypothetical protein
MSPYPGFQKQVTSVNVAAMRCTKDELLNKLSQIQEQAQMTLDELPMRLAKDRLRLIIGLSKYLSTAVSMNPGDPLPLVENSAGDQPRPRA